MKHIITGLEAQGESFGDEFLDDGLELSQRKLEESVALLEAQETPQDD